MMNATADKIEQDIKRWIQEATEPKDKALLLILFQMNSNLTENTTITKGVAAQFTDHKSKIDGILNRLRGGWLVLGFAFLVVQSMGIWIVNGQLNALEREQRRNEQQEAAIVQIQSQHTEFGRRLGVVEDQLRANDKYHADHK
jgi:hypothetical protein